MINASHTLLHAVLRISVLKAFEKSEIKLGVSVHVELVVRERGFFATIGSRLVIYDLGGL